MLTAFVGKFHVRKCDETDRCSLETIGCRSTGTANKAVAACFKNTPHLFLCQSSWKKRCFCSLAERETVSEEQGLVSVVLAVDPCPPGEMIFILNVTG